MRERERGGRGDMYVVLLREREGDKVYYVLSFTIPSHTIHLIDYQKHVL